jgi:hypothetical protein
VQCPEKRLKKSFDFERVRTIFAFDERITYTKHGRGESAAQKDMDREGNRFCLLLPLLQRDADRKLGG